MEIEELSLSLSQQNIIPNTSLKPNDNTPFQPSQSQDIIPLIIIGNNTDQEHSHLKNNNIIQEGHQQQIIASIQSSENIRKNYLIEDYCKTIKIKEINTFTNIKK